VHQGRLKIASENAIGGLMRSIARHRPSRVLEIGPGIGTLSYAMLAKMKSLALHDSGDFLFVTVEDDPFCANQLQKNLQAFDGLYRLLRSTAELEPDLDFDLIVVDGREAPDGGSAGVPYTDALRPHGMIVVEGQRNRQQRRIRESQRSFLHRKMRSANRDRRRDGAGIRNPRFKSYHVYLFEPTALDRADLIIRSSSRKLRRTLRERLGSENRPS
jgi:protein-L-isoaspartate O-methyltransferase